MEKLKSIITIIGKKEYIPHKCPYCEKLQYYQNDKKSFIYYNGKYYCTKCYSKTRARK